MNTVGAFEAKTQFSELLRRVKAGERIAITLRGKHVADLVPPETGRDQEAIDAAIDRLNRRRRSISIKGITIRELIEEGRE